MRTPGSSSPMPARTSPTTKLSMLPKQPTSAGPWRSATGSSLSLEGNDVDDGKRRLTSKSRRPRTASPTRTKGSFSFGFNTASRRSSRTTMGILPTIDDDYRLPTETMATPPRIPSPEPIPVLPFFLTTDSLPAPPANQELAAAEVSLERTLSTYTTGTLGATVSEHSDSSHTPSNAPTTPILFAPVIHPDPSPIAFPSSSRPVSETDPYTSRTSLPPPPSRTKSLNDLVSTSKTSSPGVHQHADDPLLASADSLEVEASRPVRDPRKWVKANDLIDKALYLAITDTDPKYITHFLLSFRRFTTPRALLLGMQRRLRFLDSKADRDPLFIAFAQMRLCSLLAKWMNNHPGDFAARGVSGALNAFVNAALSKVHLVHYAMEFRPFMARMSSLVDEDADWALQDASTDEESEEGPESYMEDDDDGPEPSTSVSPDTLETPRPEGDALTDYPVPPLPQFLTRSQSPTPSPPASPSQILVNSSSTPKATSDHNTDMPRGFPVHTSVPPKQLIDLYRISTEICLMPIEEVAEELMCMCTERFLVVKPRDWIRAAFGIKKGQGTPAADQDPVVRAESFTNHVADWVASLILAHDKPKVRAKTMARLLDIAARLRDMGNYSMLRAFVAGVNVAASDGDVTYKEFKRGHHEAYRRLLSHDLLLQGLRSHQAYRLALQNTSGACVPAIGIHVSDLVRAHEGNADFAQDQLELVHWGKFAILGKFVDVLVNCQKRCEATSRDWRRPPRRRLRDLITNAVVLTPEMQFSRISPLASDDHSSPSFLVAPRGTALERTYSPTGHRRESMFRRLKLFPR